MLLIKRYPVNVEQKIKSNFQVKLWSMFQRKIAIILDKVKNRNEADIMAKYFMEINTF